MKNLCTLPVLLTALIFLAASASSQVHRVPQPDVAGSEKSDAVRLPNGKLQQDEILKADHERTIKDAAQLIELAESLKQEIEKDDAHVLSISSLKKTEEIEKLAKRIRSRLKRF